jgi:hypothetical protein
MDDVLKLIDYFSKQWVVISQAPAAFAAGLAILTGICWVVLNSRHSVRHENDASTIDMLKNRLDEYKDKLNVDSPKEAQGKFEALEATVAKLLAAQNPQPISDDRLARMSRSLRGYVGTIAITSDIDSVNPVTDAKLHQFERFFQQEGWTVIARRSLGVKLAPPSGIVVINRNSEQADGRVLEEALKAAGFEYELRAETSSHEDMEPLQLNFSDEYQPAKWG